MRIHMKIIPRVLSFFYFTGFIFSSLAAAQEKPIEPAKNIQEVTTEHVSTAQHLINMVLEFVVKYSFQVIGGIIILILGWIAAKYVARMIDQFLESKSIDITINKFVVGAVKMLIMIFAGIVALGKFGIEIAPLIAGISVAGFGLSFALQGPLSNYASGATLIFTKPFKVGDIIEVAGIAGEVTDIKLPRTEVKAIDGHIIVVPNKHIIGEVIHNFSHLKLLEIKVGVSYKSDLDKIIELVERIVHEDKRVLKSGEVGILDFADSSVTIYARVWCKQDTYWEVLFDLNKKIWDTFNKNRIEIPFPQRDIHIHKET